MHPAGDHPGDFKEFAHQPRELGNLPFDDVARLPLDRVLAAALGLQPEDVRRGADGCQRVAQLVAERGEKLVLAERLAGKNSQLPLGLRLQRAPVGDVPDHQQMRVSIPPAPPHAGR